MRKLKNTEKYITVYVATSKSHSSSSDTAKQGQSNLVVLPTSNVSASSISRKQTNAFLIKNSSVNVNRSKVIAS